MIGRVSKFRHTSPVAKNAISADCQNKSMCFLKWASDSGMIAASCRSVPGRVLLEAHQRFHHYTHGLKPLLAIDRSKLRQRLWRK
jgi:hypothetical protein